MPRVVEDPHGGSASSVRRSPQDDSPHTHAHTPERCDLKSESRYPTKINVTVQLVPLVSSLTRYQYYPINKPVTDGKVSVSLLVPKILVL